MSKPKAKSKSKSKKSVSKKQQENYNFWAGLPGYADFQKPYPWQASQWLALKSRAEHNRIPQAWLFVGPSGVGKRLLAAWWMQWLQCHSVRQAQTGLSSTPFPDAPCGLCGACTQVRAQTHADCLWVSPEQIGGQIKIDQIRSVIHFMQQTAKQGGARIVIIEPVEAMNEAAQNALLKTLEEPGRGAHFILISNYAQGVLPTITSRCQRLAFGLPPSSLVSDWLTTLPIGTLPNGVTAEQAVQSLPAVSGAPLSLLSFLKDDWFEARQGLRQALLALARGQLTFSDLAGAWQEWPLVERIALVIQLFQQRLKEAMLAISVVTDRGSMTADGVGLMEAFDIYRQLLSYYQMARSSNGINELLLWEKVLLSWQGLQSGG